jgi:hypothetical protein
MVTFFFCYNLGRLRLGNFIPSRITQSVQQRINQAILGNLVYLQGAYGDTSAEMSSTPAGSVRKEGKQAKKKKKKR